MSGLARAQTYVSLHNIRSYTNVSMIENMYTSNKIDVYKGVLSVNTRKGKSICEFAQHGLIYIHEYLCYDICIFVSMCLYTKSFKVWTGKGGDVCEFARHGFIHESIYNMICVYLWIYVCKQKGSKCELSQGHRQMRVAQLGLIYKSIYNMIHVYLWRYTCIQEVESVRHSQGHKHT